MSDLNTYYNSIARKYGDLRNWDSPIPKRIVEIGRISEGTKVLDLGCGTGNLISAVRTITGCIPYGLDASQKMLEVAKGKVRDGTFVHGNVSDIPFPNGSFDCVIGALFIHHVPSHLREKVISESYRVLSTGHLIIQTMSHQLIEKMGFGEFFPEALEVTRRGFPKIVELESLYDNAGFINVTSETVHDKPITIGEFYNMAKNKVLSTLERISPESYDEGMEKLRLYMEENPDRKFDRLMTLVYGEKR
jgi:ubiquinone/menaquinone biosynthesis C-methylase UbiE